MAEKRTLVSREAQERARSRIRGFCRALAAWGVPDILIGVALGFAIGIAWTVSAWSPLVVEGSVTDNHITGTYDIGALDEYGMHGTCSMYGYVRQTEWTPLGWYDNRFIGGPPGVS